MLRWFNRNRNRLFRVVSAAWVILFLIHLFTADYSVPLGEFLGPYLVFAALYIALGSYLLNFELNRAVKAYQDRCLAQPMLETCTAMYADLNKRGRKKAFGQVLLLDRCAALAVLDRTEEAAAVLEELAPLLPKKVTPNTMVWRTHRIILLLGEHRTGEVPAAIDEAAQALERLRNPLLERRISWLLEQYRCNLSLLLWQPEDGVLEGRLLSLMDTAPNRGCRVSTAFLLGWYCRSAGEGKKAIPHLRYVAENGGDFAVREKARQLLTEAAEGGNP